MRSSNFGR